MDKTRSRIGLSLLLFAVCVTCASSWAQASNITPEDEYRDLIRVSESASPVGPHPFGAEIGLYQGSLSFLETDVNLPGNGLPDPSTSLAAMPCLRAASLWPSATGCWPFHASSP